MRIAIFPFHSSRVKRLTNLLNGAAPLDERSNATTDNGAVSGAAAS